MIKDIDIELKAALFEAKEPTSTAELARKVGCPRTMASDYMISFAKEGIVKDVGGRNNRRKWVMTEECRQKIKRELEYSEDEIGDALETLVKEDKVEKRIIGGKEQFRWKAQEEVDDREVFFAKFFEIFYPDVNPDENPGKAFLSLVSAFESVYGESSDLSRLTWFAIDYEMPEDIDQDMQDLKDYVVKKTSENTDAQGGDLPNRK